MNYDLAVIGGGPGGYVAAISAAKKGAKVILIEENELGGTCLNRGCIPTKSILNCINTIKEARQAQVYGLNISGQASYSRIRDRTNQTTSRLRQGVESLIKSNNIDLIIGHAELSDANNIIISGNTNLKTITVGKIIIATGSKSSRIKLPGLSEKQLLYSDDVFKLEEVPSSLVVIGGGVIGLEFASIFNELGTRVKIIELKEQLIPGFDFELASALEALIKKQGIEIFTNSQVIEALSENEIVKLNFLHRGQERRQIEGEKVLVSVGRHPNISGIANIRGINIDNGAVKVNSKMETSLKGVYAIGDVVGGVMLAHVASHEGLVAVENALECEMEMGYSAIPSCIYTNPQVACIGSTEEQLKAEGREYIKGVFPFYANSMAVIMGQTDGFVKVLSDKKYKEILGAHIIGPQAFELISELALAMTMGATIEDVYGAIHPHPSLAEAVMEGAMSVDKKEIHHI